MPPGVNVDRTADAVIFLPGIMGSELVDADGHVVWGMRLGPLLRQAVLGDALARIALPPSGEDDGISASRELQLPAMLPLLSSVEPYSKLLGRLRRVALRPEAVRVFAYDWRRSITAAADQLATVAVNHLAQWRSRWSELPLDERRQFAEPELSLVCHSMGGLVGRYFAEVGGGRSIVRKLVTLGTPFAGSLNAVRVLSRGDYLPFGFFAKALRDTARTFPGIYELVAIYRCVAESDLGADRAIGENDLAGVGANSELAKAASAVHRQLSAAIEDAGEGPCRIESLVGVRQPTAQRVHFREGTALFTESLQGIDHRGDGTVYRYAAAPRGVTPMPLPQAHGSLAKSEEALAFVEASLTDRELGEVQAPPGFGVRSPEAVRPGEPFEVVALEAPAGVVCRIVDADNNAPVAGAELLPRNGSVSAFLRVPAPGLYRVSVSGGGYGMVEQLLTGVSD